jgi:uncharacterized protein YbjT (DUF2867 family)
MTILAAGSERSAPERRKLVTVFGGTGFLGRRIVRRLLGRGFTVRVAARHPKRVQAVFRPDEPAPLAVAADVHDDVAVAAALVGAQGAVNAVSLYVETGRASFDAVHVDGAARLAKCAREVGVERLVHVSGIGADPESTAPYIRARGRGEFAVLQAFGAATLVRPAVMFGPDDAFLTRLVTLVWTLPIYPMFGRGQTRLQPVYVDDVAEAIARVLDRSDGADRPCYELGGPRIYTYQELLQSIANEMGTRVRTVPMPFAVWQALARVAEFLPGAPLTRNQIALMRRDNIASDDMPGLSKLSVTPTAVEAIVPEIVGRGPG